MAPSSGGLQFCFSGLGQLFEDFMKRSGEGLFYYQSSSEQLESIGDDCSCNILQGCECTSDFSKEARMTNDKATTSNEGSDTASTGISSGTPTRGLNVFHCCGQDRGRSRQRGDHCGRRVRRRTGRAAHSFGHVARCCIRPARRFRRGKIRRVVTRHRRARRHAQGIFHEPPGQRRKIRGSSFSGRRDCTPRRRGCQSALAKRTLGGNNGWEPLSNAPLQLHRDHCAPSGQVRPKGPGISIGESWEPLSNAPLQLHRDHCASSGQVRPKGPGISIGESQGLFNDNVYHYHLSEHPWPGEAAGQGNPKGPRKSGGGPWSSPSPTPPRLEHSSATTSSLRRSLQGDSVVMPRWDRTQEPRRKIKREPAQIPEEDRGVSGQEALPEQVETRPLGQIKKCSGHEVQPESAETRPEGQIKTATAAPEPCPLLRSPTRASVGFQDALGCASHGWERLPSIPLHRHRDRCAPCGPVQPKGPGTSMGKSTGPLNDNEYHYNALLSEYHGHCAAAGQETPKGSRTSGGESSTSPSTTSLSRLASSVATTSSPLRLLQGRGVSEVSARTAVCCPCLPLTLLVPQSRGASAVSVKSDVGVSCLPSPLRVPQGRGVSEVCATSDVRASCSPSLRLAPQGRRVSEVSVRSTGRCPCLPSPLLVPQGRGASEVRVKSDVSASCLPSSLRVPQGRGVSEVSATSDVSAYCSPSLRPAPQGKRVSEVSARSAVSCQCLPWPPSVSQSRGASEVSVKSDVRGSGLPSPPRVPQGRGVSEASATSDVHASRSPSLRLAPQGRRVSEVSARSDVHFSCLQRKP